MVGLVGFWRECQLLTQASRGKSLMILAAWLEKIEKAQFWCFFVLRDSRMVEKNQIRLQKLRNALSNIFYLQSYVLDQNRENSAFICSEEPELSVFICTNYHSHVLSLLVASLIFTFSRVAFSRVAYLSTKSWDEQLCHLPQPLRLRQSSKSSILSVGSSFVINPSSTHIWYSSNWIVLSNPPSLHSQF